MEGKEEERGRDCLLCQPLFLHELMFTQSPPKPEHLCVRLEKGAQARVVT